MKDNERIKEEAKIYHKGKRLGEKQELKEWLNFMERDEDCKDSVNFIMKKKRRLAELKGVKE
jgi:hypothetical protein